MRGHINVKYGIFNYFFKRKDHVQWPNSSCFLHCSNFATAAGTEDKLPLFGPCVADTTGRLVSRYKQGYIAVLRDVVHSCTSRSWLSKCVAVLTL